MRLATLLSALVLGLTVLTGCWPISQSQTLSAAPTATTVPPAKPTVSANGSPAAKPTEKPVAAVKPSPAPGTASPIASTGAAKPAPKPSPGTAGAASAASSPPAVVATSVAGLPAIVASPAPKPVNGDALGVAASANSAAAATSADEAATALCGPGAILSTRASQAAGRSATIAIAKVDGSYQPGSRGQPTFLNDAPFPNHTFTAVIWGSDRRQFTPPPEGAWQGKALCVTGPVELFQQRPQIVVSSPSQLRAAR